MLNCSDLSDETFQWTLLLFAICMEVAANIEKEHHDRWHPLVWDLAKFLKNEIEALAWEKAKAR